MIEVLVQDIRYALRHLRRSPGFAAAAILTLAFGIGANTAMFSVLNALVLQRLPIHDPDSLVSITSRNARGAQRYLPIAIVDQLARNGPLQPVCGYNGGFVIAVEANGAPAQALAAFVTGQCFNAFGVLPLLGRPLTDEDAPLSKPGNKVALISHRFWTRMFGGDPRAIGQRIRTEGVELTVVGVLPPGFGGLHVDTGGDIFAPFDTVFPSPANRRPVASEILGRLRPGVSMEQAAAELQTRWPALLEATVPATLSPSEATDIFGATPKIERMGTGLSTFRTRYVGPLTLILGLTSLLLVLVCVNLGGLLLTRVMARGVELAVRLALGGSRRRIAQQMLVESLLLSLSGAILAIPTSFAIVTPLASFIPPGPVARTISFTPDVGVLAANILVGLTAGVLMTLVPLWIAMRRQASTQFLWDRTVAGTTNRWTRALLVAQVALSVVLLVGAGLLTRSLYLLQTIDLGVRTGGVLNVKVMQLPNGYRGIDQASYYPALLARIGALPGVRTTGLSLRFPRSMIEPQTPVAFVGDRFGEAKALLEATSPGFFETVGIPLIAGRFTAWTDSDKSRHVAVVSESLARALAPDGNLAGLLDRRIRFGGLPGHQDIVVVGVVGNATQGNPRLPAVPVLYRPALQMGRTFSSPNLLVAIERDPAPVAAGVRQILQEGGREYAQEIVSLEDVFVRAPASERMSATLAAAVAGLAIVLALIGVHGTLAYSVSRRTREIGVRVAIGAAPGAVATAIVREGFVLTLVGVAIGLPAAFLSSSVLKTLMFGISEADPLTFIASALFFLAIGLCAGIVPARRAARVDPVVALRAD
jgi:predicted permease